MNLIYDFFSCACITTRLSAETERYTFGGVVILKIYRSRLLKVINTVFDKGILRIISYYGSDYHTAIL